MAKRNLQYIKPEDPKFLRLLKQEAGYSDKNPKFDQLQNSPGDFVDDDESEQPQVVVLNSGDLTAEQAAAEQEKITKDAEEAKADLTKKIIFKSSKGNSDRKRQSDATNNKNKSVKLSNKKTKLSFDLDSDEEET